MGKLADEPLESARSAGLRYVSDRDRGIRRVRAGLGFKYVRWNGAPVTNMATLRRIRALAIPPAWTDVWICPDPRGHIQATGRDARRRKQYRYHPRWRATRDDTKFDRMAAFGAALPVIRARTRHDLARRGLPREKVLATVIQLLERTLIRVGNDEYARDNHSFGLTTLRDTHVDVNDCGLRFQFRGKSGKRHLINVNDPRLARIVARCRDLPGHELFQYVDRDGVLRDVTSTDVNAYLREITGEAFTAKDFRTWAGTVLMCAALRYQHAPDSRARSKKYVMRAIETVAGMLGNTVAVCRKSYIHPRIVEAYEDGALLRACRRLRLRPGRQAALSREEALVRALIREVAAGRPVA